MKRPVSQQINQLLPRQQRNWDWRAAANFIGGGAGGGLVLWAALAAGPALSPVAILLGLALVACGLTCVWFEIGQPWRALNVFRHPSTSWMTREAAVAPLLFVSGAAALLSGQALVVALAGVFGLAFVYSQARILSADKGIPAWRHPRCLPLMVATGLTEGLALLVALRLAAGGAEQGAALLLPCAGLWILLVARLVLWRRYLAGLRAGGAPEGALRVLDGIDRRFLLAGHVLPAVAVVPLWLGLPGQAALGLLGAALAVFGGWFLKYTLVRRAAYTQGIALPHLPVRGRGTAGPAARPGWRGVS